MRKLCIIAMLMLVLHGTPVMADFQYSFHEMSPSSRIHSYFDFTVPKLIKSDTSVKPESQSLYEWIELQGMVQVPYNDISYISFVNPKMDDNWINMTYTNGYTSGYRFAQPVNHVGSFENTPHFMDGEGYFWLTIKPVSHALSRASHGVPDYEPAGILLLLSVVIGLAWLKRKAHT